LKQGVDGMAVILKEITLRGSKGEIKLLMISLWRLAILALTLLGVGLASGTETPRLRVNPKNPRWFDYGGKTIAPFGSGIWTIIPDVTVDIREHNERRAYPKL